MHMKVCGPPREVFDSGPESRKAAVQGNLQLLSIRFWALGDVECHSLDVKRTKGAGGYNLE